MKIPKPIQEVFDRFPLTTLPSAPTCSDRNLKQYAFCPKPGAASKASPSEAFVLAVHNVMPIENNGSIKYTATDPIGLANAFILCHSNSLLLPRDGAENNSQHFLMPLSYLASPDNELPIMVERIDKTQEVICAKELKNSVSRKFFKDPVERLLNDLLDGFHDMWIFALIYDIPKVNPMACQAFLFQDEEVRGAGHFITVQALKDMTRWASFRQRYSHLFHENLPSLKDASELLSGYNASSRKSFEQTYFSKLIEFDSSIPLFLEFFNSHEMSESMSILQLKFAAYFICINFFVPKETHLFRTVHDKHMEASRFSMAILGNY